MSSRPARPTGVTILGALEVCGGVVIFGMALAMIGGAYFISEMLGPMGGVFRGGDIEALGAAFMLLSFLYFALAWGLLAGRGWAWTVALVLAVLNLLSVPMGTIIGIIIIYYLTRPNVKAFFGKGPAVAAPLPAAVPGAAPTAPLPMPAAPAVVLCPSCRATIPGDAVFCGKCGADLRPRATPAAPPPPAYTPPPAAGGGRFCPSCGAAVNPGSRFCPTCGARTG